jgi:hypothetical protein
MTDSWQNAFQQSRVETVEKFKLRIAAMKSRFGSGIKKTRRVLGICIMVYGAFVFSSHFTGVSDPDQSDAAAMADITGVILTVALGMAIMAVGWLVHGRTREWQAIKSDFCLSNRDPLGRSDFETNKGVKRLAVYWASSPAAMTDDERRRWKERYRNASVEKLQASLANASPEHRRLINELIDEIRGALDAPHQRRHRELIWCTLIAAVIGALIGAAATEWVASRSQGKGLLQPAPLAVATPCASATETSAVATPWPTLEESVPTAQGEGSTPEESPQTEEPATSEELAPGPDELMPAPEESVPTPQPQERWSRNCSHRHTVERVSSN